MVSERTTELRVENKTRQQGKKTIKKFFPMKKENHLF